MSKSSPKHETIKRIVLWILVVLVIATYTIRSFFPGEPVHHELNDAGGVLIGATVLIWFFL